MIAQQIANSEQRTANSQRPTANSKRPTANSQQPNANSEKRTANSQQRTAKSLFPLLALSRYLLATRTPKPKANSQQPKAKSKQRIANSQQQKAKSKQQKANCQKQTAKKVVMRNFRQYDIWLQSVDFATEVYKLTEIFPNVEKYSLTEQIRRAVVSISSNVAEGCSRESEKEFLHYVQVALGSAFEVETQLRIALNVNYITKDQYDAIILPLDKLERQLNKLHSVLKSSIYKKYPTAKS